jgi:hypothetical protein
MICQEVFEIFFVSEGLTLAYLGDRFALLYHKSENNSRFVCGNGNENAFEVYILVRGGGY